MTFVIKYCRGEKKRGERKIDEFRKKLVISHSLKFQNVQNKMSNQKQQKYL